MYAQPDEKNPLRHATIACKEKQDLRKSIIDLYMSVTMSLLVCVSGATDVAAEVITLQATGPLDSWKTL